MKMGVEAVQDGDLFALNKLQRFDGVEYGRKDGTRTSHGRHEWSLVKPKGMEQRKVHQYNIPWGHAHPVRFIVHVPQDIVRVHDSLGETRRAGGVHDQSGAVRVDHLLTLL